LQEPLEWLKTTGFSAGRNYANKATADAPQVQNPLASARMLMIKSPVELLARQGHLEFQTKKQYN